MKAKVFLPLAALVFCVAGVNGQYPAAQPVNVSQDSVAMTANELTNISRGVQTMNEHLKAIEGKGNSSAVANISDPRQKIILGIQALAGAEQRVIQLQSALYDLTQKLNDTRGKLSQTELDLRPRNIDRSVAFDGTTETEEVRDSRRKKLQSDRINLSALLQQLQIGLQENTDLLRDAQQFANSLRRQYITLMQREMMEQ